MNKKFLRAALVLSIVLIAVYAWLRFLHHVEPDAEHAEDGEGAGEIDPDLPFAQAGDILLFNRARGLNRLITWFTKSRFYHVGISMGNNHVVEARPRGVVVRDLMGRDGDKRFEIIPSKNVGGNEVGEKAMQWAKTQVGEGYDPLNVFAIILDRTFSCCALSLTLPNHWACGEFVATAFSKAGEDLFPDKEPATIVPADFEPFLP